jgi:hypothetical protein
MAPTPGVAPLGIEVSATRKVWMRMIPVVLVLFVINYVDRVNIAFAALTMNKELAITSQQYGLIAESSSLATSFLRYRATSCYTGSERACGSLGS